MSDRPAGSTVWGLTLEPLHEDVAFSLVRSDDRGVEAVAAGILSGLTTIVEHVKSIRMAADGTSSVLEGHILTDPGRELDLSRRLGLALLPADLRNALATAAPVAPGAPVRHAVHLAVRGWLAGVPWDAVVVDPATRTRLIERALVVSRMPPAIGGSRARLTPTAAPGAPGLTVIDPGPPLDAGKPLAPVFPGGPPPSFTGPGGIVASDVLEPDPYLLDEVGPGRFGELLRSRAWSRLLYFGHVVAGRDGDPASAALVLQEAGRVHRFTAAEWLAEPDRWPAPPRVALVGCGSDDAHTTEVSGLPVAAINAGAQLVTATRWPLPTTGEDAQGRMPAAALAIAVHRAHRSVHPLDALRDWQVTQLTRWRIGGEGADSPLFWGALATYSVPARVTVRPVDSEGRDDGRG